MAILLHQIRLGLPWIALLIVVAFVAPRLCTRWFRLAERLLHRWSRNPVLAVTICGLLAFTTAAGSTLLLGLPVPGVDDEFSYLLAADTFAHGRLTNPMHPLWPFFESIHILVRPTYMSKYPAGQGLILALGQVLTGYPIVGVWIGAGLVGAALCWMLYAWLPRRYALLGGLLVSVHPLFIEWSHNYWGGLLALTAGALAVGGCRRTVDRAQPKDAGLMGLGIAVMGLTRPYEGTVLTLILLTSLVWFAWRQAVVSLRTWIFRCGLPLAAPLALFALWTLIYNHAVTGNALRLPYTLQEQQYNPVPLFVWQPLRPIPHYLNADIRDFYLKVVLPHYQEQRTMHGAIAEVIDKLGNLLLQYLQPLTLLLPLLALPRLVRRDRWARFALIGSGLLGVSLLLDLYFKPHYAAPFAGIGYCLLLLSLRWIRTWRWRCRPVGRAIARLVIVFFLANSIGSLALQSWRHFTVGDSGWRIERARILARLMQDGGDHLVMVRYGAHHNLHAEWVYNEANIDHSPVVWAHEMDDRSNRALFQYFHARRIWLLQADAVPPKLIPYPMDRTQ